MKLMKNIWFRYFFGYFILYSTCLSFLAASQYFFNHNYIILTIGFMIFFIMSLTLIIAFLIEGKDPFTIIRRINAQSNYIW